MTASRRLFIVNQSSLVDNADVKKMVKAVNKQVRDHIAPVWGNRAVVEFHTGDLTSVQDEAPVGSWVIAVMDNPDQAGALGWHWQDDKDRVYGEIFAKPCLDAGSTALSGPYAISSVLSHEAAETEGDMFCNVYVDSDRGFMVAQELCDPVEADGYEIDGVTVSNFVLPEWFDPTVSAGEKFDFLGKCKAPFTMTPGGYWVQMPKGAESQKFGRVVKWLDESGFDVREKGKLVFSPEMPEWKRELKHKYGRNVRLRKVA